MDFGEPEHIGMLRESVRRMLERHATREMMAKWDEEDKVPRSLMQHITELGVCGMTIPEEYGGTGRDILGAMVTVEELSRRSMVIGTLYLMNACYGSMNILASGSDGQPISDQIQTTRIDWLGGLLSAVYRAGLTDAGPDELGADPATTTGG